MQQGTFGIKNEPGRAKPWKVGISAKISESGKRERKFFATQKEAAGYVASQKIRLKNNGAGGVLLSPSQRDAALTAFGLLGAGDASRLVEIVREYLAAKSAKESSVTFKTMFEAFELFSVGKMRKGMETSESHKRQLKYTLPRFAGIHEKLAVEVTSEDLEGELKGVPPSARNALLRGVRAAFNYGITERGWLKVSPIKASMFRDTGAKEIEVFTNRQVSRLLISCTKHDRELLPYFALGLFAGIRPEEELGKLKWEHIQIKEGVISVPANVAKTKVARFVEIEPALAAWLKFAGVKKTGQITPAKNLRKRLQRIKEGARIGDWIQDGCRHTYASNWMALHKDEDKCRDNMGHRTKDELHRHYRKHLPV